MKNSFRKQLFQKRQGFVDWFQFEKRSKRVFCRSGEVKTRVKRVSVKVNLCSESKRQLLGPSSKRKVEFTLGKRKLTE